MVKTYPILYGNIHVGTAELTREGLFYRISCRCRHWTNRRCRVVINSSERREDLGVCVPSGEMLCLTKRMQMKRIGEEPQFYACVDQNEDKLFFVPLKSGSVFEYFEMMDVARLAVHNNEVGAIFQKEISKPTGQWSDPKISE